MVRTSNTSRTCTRLAVTATAASLVIGALAVGSHQAAAADTSTAYGIAATVSGGKAVGATITVNGAGSKAAETIIVASVSCGTGTGTGTPPGPSQPPTAPPNQPPGGGSTGQPAPPTKSKSTTSTGATKSAPKPTPKAAHRPVAVTG